MNEKTFCPFINGTCKSNCVFNCGHLIALNNGNATKCQLSAFISLSSNDDLETFIKEFSSKLIKN